MAQFFVQEGEFRLDGTPFRLLSGAVHYFRTPPEYWEDRLRKLRACGLNTVETYVSWNLHEPRPGVFDFSGGLDLAAFLRLAQELGLYAIVRPGPYICAEWDFGGLPAWLLADPALRVRCCYEPYLERVRGFYRRLLAELAPCQVSRGGNVLAVQVENEYGSYGNDKQYLAFLRDLLRQEGINALLFTSDGGWENMLSGGTLPDVFKTVNFGSDALKNFAALRKVQPDGPDVCCEFWNGWFDHWGEEHHARESQEAAQAVREVLDQGGHINLYMFHGGTNFGFTAGANCYDKYEPAITSYDDDALLTEWGAVTPKYQAVRRLLLETQGLAEEEYPVPADPPLQSVGPVAMTEEADLLDQLDALGEKRSGVWPETMEALGQTAGLILYRHELTGEQEQCDLYIDGLADRAGVFLDGAYKGRLDRNDPPGSHIDLGILPEGGRIDVLVEAMGRVNYGPSLLDRKGARQIRINNQLLSHFEMYPIPLEDLGKLRFSPVGQAADPARPRFLRGTFRAARTDCFVHLPGFTKGVVFVNGRNLGRYWAIGPQKSLYLPGVWLRGEAENELIILELEGGNGRAEILDWHDIGERKN
ncbi:MAG: beta-galactosidase [Oscillospiraceae bacterium]|jgi:beta-galactosidase|nr:beta-galactosidase [Oscillospiraceae bacterium]